MTKQDSGAPTRVQLIGEAQSALAYELRDFLKRSVVAFDWVELRVDDDFVEHLGVARETKPRLPVVRLPDGRSLYSPTVAEVADKLGWVSQPRFSEYDLSIYGAGPAGLSAAVYAASEGLRAVILERDAVGGQAGSSSMIENYLGFPQGIGGGELAERARQQAVKFGVELLMMREGVKAEFKDGRIHAQLADGSVMVARANICATGVEWRRLGIENEAKYLGLGLYYGAGASEAPFCADEEVYVVGGGNSAGQAVMHLAEHARKVTLVVRGASLADTLSSYLADRIRSNPKVHIVYDTEVVGLRGESSLQQIQLRSLGGAEEWRDTGRMFVSIGGKPNTEWAKDTAIARDSQGYLITGPDLLSEGRPPASWPLRRLPFHLETSVPGSFAAGDVRKGSIKRVAAAVGEGAMAVSLVHSYLAEA